MTCLTSIFLIAVAIAISSVESREPCSSDRCSASPCINGGVCTSTPGKGRGFTCQCPDGYTGFYCEVLLDCEQADPCNPSPCLNGGECAATGTEGSGPGYTRYKCSCTEGFAGYDCEVKVAPPSPPLPPPVEDPCDPNPCKNYQACTATPSGKNKYTCTCPPQYTGCNCELVKLTKCPSGFSRIGNSKSCYRFMTQLDGWDNQEKKCKNFHPGKSDLVRIANKKQHDVLVKQIRSNKAAAKKCADSFGWYIGLQRKVRNNCKVKEFEWKSITTCSGEQITYKNWAHQQPDCGSGNGESCVHLWPAVNYLWNDLACNTKACAICEVPLS